MNTKQVNMIIKVMLETNDVENPLRYTVQKINKVGKHRLKGAAAEDIEQYTYLLIIEYLNSISIEYWNSLTDSAKEKKLITYCNKMFEKLSKNEGVNTNITCLYNKDSKKYEYRYMNNLNIDDYELYADNKEVAINETLTRYIFTTYMNEAYLTYHQLKYVHTVTSNYIDEHGNVCDIDTNEILYTKQASYKHRTGIYAKLNSLIENDPYVITNSNGRWVLNY